MIMEKFGGEVPKTMPELLELPGIGRKSANVILGAIYGIASGIVVDTHMIRLSNRFQLAKGDNAVKIEQELIKVVPQKDWVFFSQSMVLHGRYICLAKSPRCWECHVIKICPYLDKVLSPENERGARTSNHDYGNSDSYAEELSERFPDRLHREKYFFGMLRQRGKLVVLIERSRVAAIIRFRDNANGSPLHDVFFQLR